MTRTFPLPEHPPAHARRPCSPENTAFGPELLHGWGEWMSIWSSYVRPIFSSVSSMERAASS